MPAFTKSVSRKICKKTPTSVQAYAQNKISVIVARVGQDHQTLFIDSKKKVYMAKNKCEENTKVTFFFF